MERVQVLKQGSVQMDVAMFWTPFFSKQQWCPASTTWQTLKINTVQMFSLHSLKFIWEKKTGLGGRCEGLISELGFNKQAATFKSKKWHIRKYLLRFWYFLTVYC